MKKIVCILLMFLFILTSSSCMMGGSDELSIKHVNNADGSIDVIFFDSFGDEIYRFTIPAGESGEQGVDGVGIKSITQEISEDGTKTKITITLTDPEMEVIEFEVLNGVSVVNSQRIDKEDGTSVIVFEFSDGSFSNEIPLPVGPTGNGIDQFKYILNEDNSVSILVSFTNEDLIPDVIFDIPAPQNGEDGRGIESVTSSIDKDDYVISIKYTDSDEIQNLRFPKPKDPNKWLSGYGAPLSTEGNVGDFYFDKLYDAIYFYDEVLGWDLIVNFGSVEVYHKITFNLNDSEGSRADLGGLPNVYTVKHGNYFNTHGNPDVPVPTRDGYEFKGWYTTQYPTVNSAAFNDLTPVMGELELYALWVEK